VRYVARSLPVVAARIAIQLEIKASRAGLGGDGRHVVAADRCVARDQGELLEASLSDEHAVERIAMDVGQAAGFPSVFEADRELLESGPVNEVGDAVRSLESPDRPLDFDFPDRGRADQYRICSGLDEIPGLGIEVSIGRPEEDVGVKQDPQPARPSNCS
jgi:hypothetical protein